MLSIKEVNLYLRRLHINRVEAPTFDYLRLLHQAHVTYISWQTLDIFMGQAAAIDKSSCADLIINGRSGYCFHLNHAFHWLLRSLGYVVTMHKAGIHPKSKEPNINGFHMGLIVHFADGKNI